MMSCMQVSLPMLAPLLLGTGMLFRSIKSNASFLFPRIGLVVVLLWVLWFANSVVQNTVHYLQRQRGPGPPHLGCCHHGIRALHHGWGRSHCAVSPWSQCVRPFASCWRMLGHCCQRPGSQLPGRCESSSSRLHCIMDYALP